MRAHTLSSHYVGDEKPIYSHTPCGHHRACANTQTEKCVIVGVSVRVCVILSFALARNHISRSN